VESRGGVRDAMLWRLVLQNMQEAEAHCPGQETHEVALRDVLPDLAEHYGARLELMRGNAESRLLDEWGSSRPSALVKALESESDADNSASNC
jgi:hypothetical protein